MITARIFLGAEKGFIIIIILQTEAAGLKIAISQEKNDPPAPAVTSGGSRAHFGLSAANPAPRVASCCGGNLWVQLKVL